jgi:hypothetical protein
MCMQLLQNNANTLIPIERDIQSLIETEMGVIYEIEFVSTELTVGEFRLDSLAIDEQSNSFGIV